MKQLANKSILLFTVLLTIQALFGQEKAKAELIDSYNWSGSDDASARIDNFFFELNKNPKNTGFIVVYGGKVSKKREISAHIQGIEEVIGQKRFRDRKVIVINGGYREKLTIDFWVVPENACLPLPTPTIAFESVRLKGSAPSKYAYWCCGE